MAPASIDPTAASARSVSPAPIVPTVIRAPIARNVGIKTHRSVAGPSAASVRNGGAVIVPTAIRRYARNT